MDERTQAREDTGLVTAEGRPLRRDTRCPRCRAEKDKRVRSAGFGQPHDVCSQCGYEWSAEESVTV